MQEPEAREGSTGALKDLTGPDLNVKRPSVPPESAEVHAGKPTAAESAAARESQRRSGRTRTVRVRDGFFDSSLLHYVSLDTLAAEDANNTRRSPKPLRPRASPAADYDDYDDDVPLGQRYQATCIPAFRPLPAQPTASEEKFLHLQPLFVPGEPEVDAAHEKHVPTKTRAGRAGVTVPMPPIGVASSSSDFRYKWRWAKDSQGRRSLLSAAVNALDKQLGPEKVQMLGLEGLGFKRRQTWQPHEELLFAMGMCDKYRMFKYIRQCYLWNRSVHELNGYYNNVWKTRSTDLAEEFLTMRQEGATRQEYAAYVDKVRDQLTSMWDRKKMGDMPKLLKDAAALAAAERAAPAAAPKAQQPSKPRSRASPEGTGGASYDGSESDISMDSADSEKRAAHRRQQQQQQQQQQQRKRAATAVSGGVPGRPPKRPVNSGSSGHEGAPRQRDPQQQQSSRSLHASGVSAGLPTWGHPGQPLHQKPRTAGRGAPGMRRTGSCSHPLLELPAMPRAPRPTNNDNAAVAHWLKALPTFRSSMKHHLEEVHDMTEAAIKECEDFIAQLKVQREQREEEAKHYISSLLDQGRQVLVKIEAGEQAQKQAQHLAELKLRQEQRAQQQEPASADAPAQPAALARPAPTTAAAAGSASPAPAAAVAGSEAQPVKQEQQDAEMADTPLPAPTGVQQQLQQQQLQSMDAAPAADQLQEPKDIQYMPAQAPTAGPIAMGPPAARPARMSWQHQQQPAGAAVKEDSQKQQQPAQQSDTAAGTDVGVAAALPFPGGWALAQWTAQPSPAPGPAAVRVQVGNNPDSVVTKHIPRPYVRH